MNKDHLENGITITKKAVEIIENIFFGKSENENNDKKNLSKNDEIKKLSALQLELNANIDYFSKQINTDEEKIKQIYLKAGQETVNKNVIANQIYILKKRIETKEKNLSRLLKTNLIIQTALDTLEGEKIIQKVLKNDSFELSETLDKAIKAAARTEIDYREFEEEGEKFMQSLDKIWISEDSESNSEIDEILNEIETLQELNDEEKNDFVNDMISSVDVNELNNLSYEEIVKDVDID